MCMAGERGPVGKKVDPRRDGGRERVIEVGWDCDMSDVGVTADLGCC